jgi:hypothetical protein
MTQQHQASIGHPVAVTYPLGISQRGLPTGSGNQQWTPPSCLRRSTVDVSGIHCGR